MSTLAIACACGVEPIPASLEKRPLDTPLLIASLTTIPPAPPAIAAGLNAQVKIEANAPGTFL